jgi:hypothetical protein
MLGDILLAISFVILVLGVCFTSVEIHNNRKTEIMQEVKILISNNCICDTTRKHNKR